MKININLFTTEHWKILLDSTSINIKSLKRFETNSYNDLTIPIYSISYPINKIFIHICKNGFLIYWETIDKMYKIYELNDFLSIFDIINNITWEERIERILFMLI